jgi:KDO2-lipid IV(A) lauroyltransferase
MRAVIALLWLAHWLPARWQAALGVGLGRLLFVLAASRRRIARRNLALCLPELDTPTREGLLHEHFELLGRSLVDRGLLWFAPRARLERLIEIQGDVRLAERVPGPVMWLVPHFLALEVAAVALQLFQSRHGATIYRAQSHPVLDAAIRAGRCRFADSLLVSRRDGVKPLLRAIRQQGFGFFNLPDMDFGRKDAAFVPFFGVPAATLLAPARLARLLQMTVQPVVAEIKPGGGWRVRLLPPCQHWPSDDPVADAARMNEWIETEVRRAPAQYLWVHRRFKTRPEGERSVYERAARAPRAAVPRRSDASTELPTPAR